MMSEKLHLPLIAGATNSEGLGGQIQVKVPYLFTIKDMLSTDWVIVPES
jgi:hypothetical protein